VTIAGAILMLSSTFFASLVASDAHCAAQVWLLSFGFTLTYAPCFIKTFRIWRIFGTRSLRVVKMKDKEMLLAIAAFVAIDCVINAVWMGTAGMMAKEVVVDPIRPKYNHLDCDYSDTAALGAVYAHVALKGGMLIVGALLAVAVRAVPSAFNESVSLGVAIYNSTICLCFVLPVLAVGLGGRDTTYLLRSGAVMFIAMTTVGILYVPKLMLIRRQNRVHAAARRKARLAGGGDAVAGGEEVGLPFGIHGTGGGTGPGGGDGGGVVVVGGVGVGPAAPHAQRRAQGWKVHASRFPPGVVELEEPAAAESKV
jgi:hypothetical protein